MYITVINDKSKTGNEIKTIIRTIEEEITRFKRVQMDGVTSKGSEFKKSVFEYVSTEKGNANNDRGSSYRSVIFLQDEEERKVAEEVIQIVNNSKRWSGKVVTSLKHFKKFWLAEPGHQGYLFSIPNGYNCHFKRFGTFL